MCQTETANSKCPFKKNDNGTVNGRCCVDNNKNFTGQVCNSNEHCERVERIMERITEELQAAKEEVYHFTSLSEKLTATIKGSEDAEKERKKKATEKKEQKAELIRQIRELDE